MLLMAKNNNVMQFPLNSMKLTPGRQQQEKWRKNEIHRKKNFGIFLLLLLFIRKAELTSTFLNSEFSLTKFERQKNRVKLGYNEFMAITSKFYWYFWSHLATLLHKPSRI